MTVVAERLNFVQEGETINRRTDDLLHNVRYLQANIIDTELKIFETEAEVDVLEQNLTEISEADVHRYGPLVYQRRDHKTGQFISMSRGTVDNNILGVESVDTTDEKNVFEFFRRVEEVTDEVTVLDPRIEQRMRAGAAKIFVSPSPTHHEADLDAAIGFGYDDRTMFRIQRMSPDGSQKTMQSFTLFDVPAKTWAAYFSDRYGESVEPTALAVMQFCNRVILQSGSTAEILSDFIGGVRQHAEPEVRDRITEQLEAFIYEQGELERHASYYAKERLAFQKELALSLDGPATPAIERMISDVYDRLHPSDKRMLHQNTYNGKLYVDEEVAALAVRINTVTNDNRAGLAAGNERTVKRIASRVGLETALDMAVREQYIQRADPQMRELMARDNERRIAESGAGCGGGCSVDVVDLFSKESMAAEKAGVHGKLYTSNELNKNSKCGCKKAQVVSNGKDVFCFNCKEFMVNGKRGNLRAEAGQK